MLECQKETKNKGTFICQKLSERIGMDNYIVHANICAQCNKLKHNEDFLKRQEESFYTQALMQPYRRKYLERSKEYVLDSAVDSFIYDNILSNILEYLNRAYIPLNQRPIKEYFFNNVLDLNIEEFSGLINDEEKHYQKMKKIIIDGLQLGGERYEVSIKRTLATLSYKKETIKRMIKEEKALFSKSFLEEIKTSFKEYDYNLKESMIDPSYSPVSTVSLVDKIKGLRLAFLRIREQAKKDGLDKLWVSEREAIERQICCTTCTDGTSCPYCGCNIKSSWFLPLGKSNLSTEGCPNSQTYPHLKSLPSMNYWEVCNKKTSVIISARNEKYLNKTIEGLIENATGEIEIIVGLDGYEDDVIEDDAVTVIRCEEHIGRRKMSNRLCELATGEYLFEIDAHCKVSYGWDTKLKCVCDKNTIVGCSVNELNEESWDCNFDKWVGGKIVDVANWNWDKVNQQVEKIEESESFNACGWMIRKDYFEELGGHDEELGEWGWENVEWTMKNKKGKIIIRTDVVVSHLFRAEYPYRIKGKHYKEVVSILNNKDIYKD